MKIGRWKSRLFHLCTLFVTLWVIAACQTKPLNTSALSTPTAVPSPMPTLTLTEKTAVTSELYNTNANCELPCWWGIVPGETDWDTAQLFLNTIASEMYFHESNVDSLDFNVEVDVPVPDDLSEIDFLRHTFIVKDGIIVKIEQERPRGIRRINTIAEILKNYGRPKEVWLDTVGYTFGDSYYPFRVALFYPEMGILIRYFDDAELFDDYLTGCPQRRSGKLTLWSPNLELSFMEALGSQQGAQYNKPLGEATEMDVETFYQTYLDPDTETCIETPVELWLDR